MKKAAGRGERREMVSPEDHTSNNNFSHPLVCGLPPAQIESELRVPGGLFVRCIRSESCG